MKHTIILKSNNGTPVLNEREIILKCTESTTDTRFSMSLHLTDWEDDAYIFLPACVYDGNKFKKSHCQYPPMYTKGECGIDPEPVISDIPALNPDGSGKIEVTAADMSVPCVGVFYKQKKKGLLLFTEQECYGRNIGFAVSSGSITVQFPAARENCYRMCNSHIQSSDCGFNAKAGNTVSAKVEIHQFECKSLPDFFKYFFEHRASLLSAEPSNNGYTDELWNVLEEHMNRDNFSGEYYAEMSQKWQCGWVGGGMSSLPLLQYGQPKSKKRAIRTIDFMTANVAASGFFYPMIENGAVSDDSFGVPHMKNCMLTRKNGDALYFLFKHFDIIEPKSAWVEAAKKCADAFVRLYDRYGNFGQFVDVETGEMLFGGTTSGASAISALVRAYRYFNDDKYLKVAVASGEKYYARFIARGLTYGGPGEALCAPDSESCYAMLEALILLYEETNDKKWLTYAENALYLFSTWVMPYAFKFPKDSEFARLNINTVGSVFANAQNKHSAPGICTASGDAIYKLYYYTKNEMFLDLLKDIALFMPQCVSTEARPVFSWDVTPKRLGDGWICERVNTSDWEGEDKVGEVFHSSCWCESALLLAFSELIKSGLLKP